MVSANLKQIKSTLLYFFNNEGHRIVFWNDPDGEFSEMLDGIDLEGVNILRLDQKSPLEIKILLELEDRQGSYLLYDLNPEPLPEEDWLLDIRLYSRTFYADKASIILDDLGLASQSLRSFLNKRKNFLRSRERLERLKKWVKPDDLERDLDLKMLAVVTRASYPDLYLVLMSLFPAFCSNGAYEPNDSPKIWTELKKLELEEIFWEAVYENFGYKEDNPRLHDLAIRLFVSDFGNELKADLPVGLEHFLLPQGIFIQNCSVFLSQWRNHRHHSKSYALIAKFIEEELGLSQQIASFDVHALEYVMTFEAVEQRIIVSFRDKIAANTENEFSEIKKIIKQRLDGYWVDAALANETDSPYRATYAALQNAMGLLELRNRFPKGLGFTSAKEMFEAYTGELFKFDLFYRLFHEKAAEVELRGWDVLKGLSSEVEACYSGWYLDQLSLTWDTFLDGSNEENLLTTWNLPGIVRQTDFFRYYVESSFMKKGLSHIAVIVSDGLRFETVHELQKDIGGKYGFGAELSAMLGVLPSYTALGMAALLPHKNIKFDEFGNNQILLDNRHCVSFEQRSAILKRHRGIAVRAEDLLAMNKQAGREFIKPHRVIYIYHNIIDATGDKAATEAKTFESVRTAISELSKITRFLINNLNLSLVLITSDHGFIYQDSPPKSLDRSHLEVMPKGTVIAKKRFILGRGLGRSKKVWHGTTHVTAGTEDDMEFWLPKGMNRFHFKGGARYFHGGASLPEIVVPVLNVRKLRGKEREKSQVKKVGVSLIGSHRKIVMNHHRFEFIQTDAVTERTRPRTLLISLRDRNELISNEETVTFDSTSSEIDERKQSVRLILKQGEYDRQKEYFLLLRDAETSVEYARIPIRIDLAFASEF